MILLRKIILNNFISHASTIIEFNENDKTLFDGLSGAGKSSIFDAIIWALYGVSRTDNRSLIKRGTKKSSVILELSRKSDVVIIARSITSTGKHSLEISIQQPNGSKAAYPLSGIRELQNWIDKELIGASYLLFVNSVAYVQGNNESFVSQTASKRKELLLEIIGTEGYKKYYELARMRLVELEKDKSYAYGQIIELEAQIEVLGAHVGDRASHATSISKHATQLNKIAPRKKNLEQKKALYMAASKTIGVLADGINTARAEWTALMSLYATKKVQVNEKDRLQKLLTDKPKIELELTDSQRLLESARESLRIVSDSEAKRNEVFSRKPQIDDRNFVKIDNINREIEKISAEPVCPSGVDCPYSGDYTEKIKKLKSEIKEYERTIQKETTAFNKWTAESNKLPASIDMQKHLDKMKSIEEKVDSRKIELSKLNFAQQDLTKLEEIEAELPGIEEEFKKKSDLITDLIAQRKEAEESTDQAEINRVANGLLEIYEEERVANEGIARATAMLESIDRDEEELKATETRIATLETEEKALGEKARKVAMVKQAFGSKGIETLILDYLLPKLEDRINEILSKLSDFRIRIDTQRKSADGESDIEGLYLFVANEMGQEMEFNNYSGGEKIRITIAVSEALASLHKSIGFRIMDEAIFGLSQEMVQDFTSVLAGLQVKYPQILCVSHLPEVKSMFEKVTMITKHNGISKIDKPNSNM